jgi:hypothetical protein
MKLLFIFFFAIAPNVFLLKSRIQVNHILKSKNCRVLKVDKDTMYCDCEDYNIKMIFDENGFCKEMQRSIKQDD